MRLALGNVVLAFSKNPLILGALEDIHIHHEPEDLTLFYVEVRGCAFASYSFSTIANV